MGQQISACILDLVFFLQQELTSTEGQRSIERAMSQIVASLEACGRYLETMKTFPSFMQAKESQLSSLTCQFGRHSWSLSEGSEALELLQRQAIWNETERSSLALAIQNGLSARAAATSRQTMQDYTNVILYLPKSIWEQLMNADLTFQAKANLLGVFATTLGMKTPSEATSQMMTALLLACPGGRELELKCSLSPVAVARVVSLGEEGASIERCCRRDFRCIAACREIADKSSTDGSSLASTCSGSRTGWTMSFELVSGGRSGSDHSHEEHQPAIA